MNHDTDDHHNNKATTQLLQLLCTEIARDGGASLVTSLKDYVPSQKRLNSLLVRSIGKPKLLTFLESHSNIFQVDRQASPHWVVLLTNSYVLDDTTSTSAQQTSLADAKRQLLVDRAIYVLRKRQARLERRQTHHDDVRNPYKVTTPWLLKLCTWELHFYLRAADVYRQELYNYDDATNATNGAPNNAVLPVGSEAWQEQVTNSFESVILTNESLSVENHKAWLSVFSSKESYDDEAKEQYHDIQELDEMLTQLVDQDGGHQVSFTLLLHRHAHLKQILGGRDLWSLVQKHPDSFKQLNLSQSGPGNDVVLQSKKPKRGRLQTDEVGLYCVANSKWGNCMAKIMVQACQKVGFVDNVPAIDVTASIGGITLALAKANYFDKIIAIEIDSERAKLCEQNMQDKGFQDLVEVHNMDAVEVIRILPKMPYYCVVIDPPWGGVAYKRDTAPLRMGKWLLDDVVEQISQHLTPSVVGVRLPVTFQVDTFVNRLREQRGLVELEVLWVRKLSVQLFLVLHLRTTTTTTTTKE